MTNLSTDNGCQTLGQGIPTNGCAVEEEGNFYNEKFYKSIVSGSLRSAEIVLKTVFEVLPKINSAVDFGCGTGTWLSVLTKLGVNEIKGFDGSWAKNELLIPQECFTAVNFDKEIIKVEKKYDLAISLEVAEHIPEQMARTFVKTITNASDIVLFSAAIPYQGGTNHINEQWQNYWRTIFVECGYVGTDFIRSTILNAQDVEMWYKQNIVLYVRKEKMGTVSIPEQCFMNEQLDFVHPELYLTRVKHLKTLNVKEMPLLKLYRLMLKRTIKKMLGIDK